MFRKITLALVAICFISSIAGAQQMGLYFMDGLWQANQVNPAFLPERRTIYSFPSIYVNVHNNFGSYNDLISTDANGKTTLDLDPIIGKLDKSGNALSGSIDVETFSVTFGSKIWRGSVTHAFRTRSLLSFPKALPNLLWNGNAPFIGQTMNIAPEMQVMSYSELGLGFGLNMYKFTFGGRLKILSGIMDASTERNRATVHTDEDIYQLHFETDYSFNAAALLDYSPNDDFDPELKIAAFSPNLGLGLDLGVKFQYSDELTLSASIIDLGAIGWKTNAKNFSSKGSYTYEGEDLTKSIQQDSFSFQETVDTLENIFDFQETSAKYSTALPFKTYLGATYRINQYFRVGGLLYAERYRKINFGGIALNAGVDLGKIFSAGVVYSIYDGTYDNLGVNAVLRLGPVQLFTVFDNVLGMSKLLDSQNVNARFGLNLAFK